MTKKDYILIAGVIKASRDDAAQGDGELAREAGIGNVRVFELAERMARALAGGNPRFDRVRFLTACDCLPWSERQ